MIIDAKSGVSGAGRGAAEEMEVVKSGDDSRPYKVDGHRHAPEIAQEVRDLGSAGAALTFVPHLLPFDQGELVSCYVTTTRAGRRRTASPSSTPTATRRSPSSRSSPSRPASPTCGGRTSAASTSTPTPSPGRVFAFAAIDNLWKGAASQAVQNLNLMLGLPEGQGIS